jgi:DNA-binding Lrp family transcriptional regulator
MDETDIRLCQMLFINSRAPVRDLSDKLDISVQATHRRMQMLRDEGLVNRYKASLSLGYLKAIRLLVNGSSPKGFDDVGKALRGNEYAQSVFIGEGQQIFLECIIRDVKDIDPVVDYLWREVGIAEPQVSLDSIVKFGDTTWESKYRRSGDLSLLDYQIVHALHEDARMSVADIAVKCEASVRTVTRHLDRMISDGAIDFYLDWRPGNVTGLTALTGIILKKDSDPKNTREEIDRRFGGSLFLTASLSNLVGVIISNAWSPSIKKYNELLDSIRETPGVEMVSSTILKGGWIQDTWRDKILKEKAGSM